MLKIRDIMTEAVYTVDENASAQEVAWGLTRRHVGGAPVCDSEGRLTGVVSKGDLINPEPDQWIKGEATVADLMTPDVVSVYADDPALVAASAMAERNIHRLVVLGTERTMVGIVSTMDIVKALVAGKDFRIDANDAEI